MISAVVTQPTADLLARTGESLIGSPVLPWIMKVDYVLEVILNSLAMTHPASVTMARPTNVNLSGGGMGFVSLEGNRRPEANKSGAGAGRRGGP